MKHLELKLAVIAITSIAICTSERLYAQFWSTTGLNTLPGTQVNNLGTAFILPLTKQPINIFTGGKNTAKFSANNTLPSFATPSTSGDGLSIISPAGNTFNLDMWVDPSPPPTVNQHIRWGQWGLAEGGGGQFRVTGYVDGLWLDANSNGPLAGGNPRMIFNRNANEVGRFGLNNFLRIGANTTALDAATRVEIVDPANAPQFRIAQTSGAAPIFTDFQTTSGGDLNLTPRGAGGVARNVGIDVISTAIPTPNAKLDIWDASGLAHLRLTSSFTTSGVARKWTGFMTTAAGDLFISPFDNLISAATQKPRFVGIQTQTPGNTLEINSQAVNAFSPTPATAANTSSGYLAPNPLGGTGFSGLRFSDLTAASTAVPTASVPTNNVLSLDNNGDIILVPGGSGNVTACATAATNFLTKFTSTTGICTSGVFEDPANFNIGIGTITPQGEVEIFSNGFFAGNTLPVVRNGGTSGAGWRFIAGGAGAKDWAIHSSGPANFQGTGKLVFKCVTDSTTPMTIISTGLTTAGGEGRVGIGTFAPNNLLEINTLAPNAVPASAVNTSTGISTPNPLGGTGFSGLRFTDLTSNSVAVTTIPTTNLLSVDLNGDVILVPGSSGVGALCTSPTPFNIAGNTRVGLSNNNFYFDGQGFVSAASMNAIGIGYNCGALSAKLDVLETASNLAILGTNNSGLLSQTGVKGSVTAGASQIGVYGTANGGNNQTGIRGEALLGAGLVNNGGDFIASGVAATFNTGVLARAFGALTRSTGGDFVCTGSSPLNVGTRGMALSGTQNIGVFGALTGNPPLVTTNLAGYFDGDIYTTGGANSLAGYVSGSDRKIKTDTTMFFSGLNIIRNIHPISYRLNGKAGGDTTKTNIGVFAEDVASIAPYAVDTFFSKLDSTDTQPTLLLGIKNEAILYTSINAIKQLDSALTKATSAPDAPVLISPADGAVGSFGKGQFIWHSVSHGLVFYSAHIAKDSAFSNLVSEQNGITDTATFFSVLCDSLPTTYYWRVNAKNNTGTSAWSQVFSFTDTATCSKTPQPGPEPPIRALSAVGFNSTSDSNFKTNIAPVTNALDKVSQLNGVYYDWVHTNPKYEFDSTQQVGFIAQDVQSVVPQVVRTDSNGFLTLDYGRMVPVLVEAIKELKAWKDSVSNNSMRTTNNAVPSTEEELASENAILYQNTPNPFGDGTSIGYFVAENTTDAYIVFYDEFGNEIKKSNLPHRGQNAKLNLTTQNLASGIYTYSLVVNGKIAGTKKMIKTK